MSTANGFGQGTGALSVMVRASTLVAGVLALSVFATPQHALAENGGEEEVVDRTLLDLNDRFNRSVESKHVSSMLSLYSADVLWLPPNAPLQRGRGAAESNYAFLAEHSARLRHTVEHTIVSADGSQAVMIGAFMLEIDALSVADEGKYLLVVRHGEDGWKIVADMFSSDRPPPACADQ